MQHPDARALFDAEWYASRYCPGSDGEDAWQHFLSVGSPSGLDPNPLFDSRWYLEAYAEARDVGALQHFLAQDISAVPDPSLLFESQWYLHSNPDVRDAAINPLAHYISWGRHEGRKPNRWCTMHAVGDVIDWPLSERFEPDDLIGYIPGYSTLPRLFSGIETSSFISPIDGRWVVARLTSFDVADAGKWSDDAGVIGGRAEILHAGRAYDPDFDGFSASRYRAFCIEYTASPIVRNAVSALALDATAVIARGLRARAHGANDKTMMLVDADVRGDVVRAGAAAGAIAIIALDAGTLCRVAGLIDVPIEKDRDTGNGGIWQRLRRLGKR